MSNEEPENRNGFTRIGEEDWAEIEKLAETWVTGLPFESVYQFTKRFHVHLLTMMFCNDKENFEEIKEDSKNEQESGIEEMDTTSSSDRFTGSEEDLTKLLVKSLDLMVGFDGKIGEGMYLSVQADEVELPDKEYFKKLGLD